MLAHVSWRTYIGIMLCLVLLYYGYVLLKYYSFEMKRLLSGKRNHIHDSGNGTTADEEYKYEMQSDPIAASVQELLPQIRDRIKVIAEGQYNKTDRFYLLKDLLAAYPDLKASAFRLPIQEYIQSECEKQDVARLDTEEVEQLWLS
ncbi:hypothetical protein [Chitinophaga sancti]|uniref:Uncharacterized protein n=1 Tax=Chitinophaga sancti TaxID=1004 RepID=A0A1K1T0I4_9BACT|nr:hypothetical protein [Chitinophaga sancti]WQD65377.1 hypothetical protein U0033_13330 [Chitinophaga sancti]WQG88999.1 hypothetical protein SR876_29140 [Chitinophaga sancti]SFW89831.1 hypothetical protein SAMN05661012_06501 [Chitinophaga sancti]